MTARYKKNVIQLGNKAVTVYATPRISTALDALIADMSLYEGVRFVQLLEAMYDQGRKDGARKAIEAFQANFKAVAKAIPHRNPGQPKKN